MDKKIVSLLGAVAAVGLASGVAAASSPAENSAPPTYRDLLNPVSDPVAALRSDNQRLADQKIADKTVIIKKGHRHHHHHHHHHHDHDRG